MLLIKWATPGFMNKRCKFCSNCTLKEKGSGRKQGKLRRKVNGRIVGELLFVFLKFFFSGNMATMLFVKFLKKQNKIKHTHIKSTIKMNGNKPANQYHIPLWNVKNSENFYEHLPKINTWVTLIFSIEKWI